MSEFASAKFANIFAHPLMSHVWPDGPELNVELKARILAEEKANPGDVSSNIGGWHSRYGKLEFCGDAGRRLIRHMYAMGAEATRATLSAWEDPQAMRAGANIKWTLDAWANVNRTGDFNRMHTHASSTWSGTYYVDIGEPEAGPAPIHLMDPCQGRANTFLQRLVPTSYLIPPEPGLMILFPSYLPHMVFPHKGAGTRISIAFNLRREPFP